MHVDRTLARDAFEAYVSGYDARNPRIALKVEHTIRVAELCDEIARSLGLSPEEIDLAWLVGLLHDVGRFEQVRRYNSFNDRATVSHAALGVEVLFGTRAQEGIIRNFAPSPDEDGLIRRSVALHSELRLPDSLEERDRTFCNILRDADKIDILKVNCINTSEEIYGVSNREMAESILSDEVERVFYEHRCIPRDIKSSPIDLVVGHICFAYELVYPISLEIVLKQGHLQQILDRRFEDPDTDKRFRRMGQHIRMWACEKVRL
ncbi:MAG: HD domain-containing protein [Olsenella sp.]|nr:HD domain-containing protein [Olsenella sp.]